MLIVSGIVLASVKRRRFESSRQLHEKDKQAWIKYHESRTANLVIVSVLDII